MQPTQGTAGCCSRSFCMGHHLLRRWQSCSDRTNGSRQAAEFPCMPRGHMAKGEGGRGAGRGGRRRRRSQEEATRRRRPYTSKRHTDTDARVAAQRLSLAVAGAKKGQECCRQKGCTLIRQNRKRSWHRAGNRGLSTKVGASNPYQQSKEVVQMVLDDFS